MSGDNYQCSIGGSRVDHQDLDFRIDHSRVDGGRESPEVTFAVVSRNDYRDRVACHAARLLPALQRPPLVTR